MNTLHKLKRGVGPELFIDEEWLALHRCKKCWSLSFRSSMRIITCGIAVFPDLVNEFLSDLRCGHAIRGICLISEAGYGYRVDGDPGFCFDWRG
jgi:hypothetical protein